MKIHPGNDTLRYFDIAWLSRYDGPGHRVVLYLQGCRLRCPWCHSPHSQPRDARLLYFPARCRYCGCCAQACPQGAHHVTAVSHSVSREHCAGCGKCIDACPVSGRDRPGGALMMPAKEIPVLTLWDMLYPQLDVFRSIGGFTASGGEALLQSKPLSALLRLCKEEGIHTAVETSGAVPQKHIKDVAGLTDCWLFGLRPTRLYTPPHAELIADNLAFLAGTGAGIIIRTPVIGGVTDLPESLEAIAERMQANGLHEIQLLPFNRETFHYYLASGRECAVGTEAAVSPERMEDIRTFFLEKNISASIIQ